MSSVVSTMCTPAASATGCSTPASLIAASFDWEGSLFPSAGLDALLLKQEPLDTGLLQFQELGELSPLPAVPPLSLISQPWFMDDFASSSSIKDDATALSSVDLFEILKRPLMASGLGLADATGETAATLQAPFDALGTSSGASSSSPSLADEDGHIGSEDYLALLATTSPIDSDALSSLLSEDDELEFDFDLPEKDAAPRKRKVPAPKASRKKSSAASAAYLAKAAFAGSDMCSESSGCDDKTSASVRRRKHVQDMSEEERVHVRELGRLAAQRSRQARRQRWLDLKRRGKSLNEEHNVLAHERTALLAKIEALKKQLKASLPSMLAAWQQEQL